MKFVLGEPPKNDFTPELHMWNELKEPKNALVAQLIALPIGIFLIVFVYVLAIIITKFSGFSKSFSHPSEMIQYLIAMIIIIPIHEILHACVFPEGIKSKNTILGFWPKACAFYGHYDGEMSRNRFIIVFLLPLISLSVFPIIAMGISGYINTFVIRICLVNAFAACVDMLGVILFATQVPKNAVVRNLGWKSYWIVK
ncbi:MAG TPA: metalloprotease family protein [Pseudobacteroides sp.]|uniref:metalloprotease family protein n=1 Tax=Pseudobacteroides sp. TaxID=1968840 RepID=UPI002F931997